jgi:hypothetical protein
VPCPTQGRNNHQLHYNQQPWLSSIMSRAGQYKLVPSTAHQSPRCYIFKPDSARGKVSPQTCIKLSSTGSEPISSKNSVIHAASSGRSHSQREGGTMGVLPSLHVLLANIENIIPRHIRPSQLLQRLDADASSQMLLRWSVLPALLLALQPLAAPSQVGPGPMWQVRMLMRSGDM